MYTNGFKSSKQIINNIKTKDKQQQTKVTVQNKKAVYKNNKFS